MFKLGWLVPGSAESRESFLLYGHHLTHVSPTWLRLDAEATLHVSVEPSEIRNVLAWAEERGVSAVPLVVNEAFKADVAGAILSNPNRRRKAVEALARFAETYRLAGINLDFEGPFGHWRDHYTAFVYEMSERLHGLGMQLSVDVVCQTGPPKPIEALRQELDPASAAWVSSWAEPYDYLELGQAVDQFILMGYDYHARNLEPGPVGPLWWLRKVLGYTLKIVPANKIVLGLPFYARAWTSKQPMAPEAWSTRKTDLDIPLRTAAEAGFEPGDGYGYVQIAEHLTEFVRSGRDPETSPWGIWPLEDGRITVVHYDDAQSLREKSALIDDYKLAGTAFWRLGQEDPGVWGVL
ncbi:MAG: spore peptidoglycan hydrolase (N-acetylglucosaminidase) [Candidatus Carbobacillus altaicus]|uniref:Spore peptidoglycan hydrolase (N-acetylglucosaminidase) n=1 Tax=Candidatus Carbonibacillus altaicus TaxID=2163959 RepID=A0A2R6Y1U4_9BACL|nr:MAG: spore peptidoglycan hydrolase (N-acetylglucosaminidase) [Candidatus Carbobacillus altaicus]